LRVMMESVAEKVGTLQKKFSHLGSGRRSWTTEVWIRARGWHEMTIPYNILILRASMTISFTMYGRETIDHCMNSSMQFHL
jgi:hypothetical protein